MAKPNPKGPRRRQLVQVLSKRGVAPIAELAQAIGKRGHCAYEAVQHPWFARHTYGHYKLSPAGRRQARRMKLGPVRVAKFETARLTHQQQALAETCMRLAWKRGGQHAWHKRHRYYGMPFETLKEEYGNAALLAVAYAARDFQPERQLKFSTYADWKIRGAISNIDRALVKHRRLRPVGIGNEGHHSRRNKDLNALCITPSRELPPEEQAAWNETMPEQQLAGPHWQKRLAMLPPQDRQAIELRFREGLTLQEAGQVMKVSKERVRQLEQRALWRLRQILQAEHPAQEQKHA